MVIGALSLALGSCAPSVQQLQPAPAAVATGAFRSVGFGAVRVGLQDVRVTRRPRPEIGPDDPCAALCAVARLQPSGGQLPSGLFVESVWFVTDGGAVRFGEVTEEPTDDGGRRIRATRSPVVLDEGTSGHLVVQLRRVPGEVAYVRSASTTVAAGG